MTDRKLPDSATASVAFLARGGPTYVASERAVYPMIFQSPPARPGKERHVNVGGLSPPIALEHPVSWSRQRTGYMLQGLVRWIAAMMVNGLLQAWKGSCIRAFLAAADCNADAG
jgi:hypothetical protein